MGGVARTGSRTGPFLQRQKLRGLDASRAGQVCVGVPSVWLLHPTLELCFWELGKGEMGLSGLLGCVHGSAGCHGAPLPGTEVLPRARHSKTNLLDHFNKWRRDVVVRE